LPCVGASSAVALASCAGIIEQPGNNAVDITAIPINSLIFMVDPF
jgi:hypothetical protein